VRPGHCPATCSHRRRSALPQALIQMGQCLVLALGNAGRAAKRYPPQSSGCPADLGLPPQPALRARQVEEVAGRLMPGTQLFGTQIGRLILAACPAVAVSTSATAPRPCPTAPAAGRADQARLSVAAVLMPRIACLADLPPPGFPDSSTGQAPSSPAYDSISILWESA
jgi:hypothetical protein